MNSSRRDPNALSNPPEGTVFVGRDREIRDLNVALEDAVSGRGHLFFIGGEPGIGKSWLADEMGRRAEERGFSTLWGRCWEAGGAPAYWPWVQSLRSHVESCDPEALREQVGVGAPFVAQILPELKEHLPGVAAPPALDSEGARFQLFDAVAGMLHRMAAFRPLLLVLDDLHVADAPSLLLLRFLANEITDSRILIIGAYRHTEVGPDHPLAAVLAEARREPGTRGMVLEGLAEPEVRRFIEANAGVLPRESLVRAVHAETEGNPLFLREIVQLLAREGRLADAGERPWWKLNTPPGVRQVIRRRIGELSEECNRLLVLASVLGREFSVEALERLSGEPTDTVWPLLDEAVAARAISDLPGTPGRFRFDHVLIRDAFYQELTPGRRVRLHRSAGEMLESLYGDTAHEHLSELAHHFFEAAPAGDVDRALACARAAGERAVKLLAFEEAARLYRMALRVLELKRTAEPELRCELLLALGDAEMRANMAAGSETFLEATRLARSLDSPPHLARAALGYGGRFVWSRGACDPSVVPLLREALAALDREESELRARLLARLAGALRDQPAGEERDALSAEAVEIARRLGDPATLAYTLDGRYAATWEPGNAEGRLGIADELVRVAEAAGDLERAIQGHHYRLIAHLELGDIAAAHAALDAKARLVEDLRQPAQRWYLAVMRASLELFRGGADDAEPLIEGALRLNPDSWFANCSYRMQMFALRREQDRLAELETLIRSSVDAYAVFPVYRAMLALLHVELGREEEARLEFEALAADDFADLPWDCEWIFCMTLLAEVACALEDTARAATLYRLLSPYERFNVVAPAEVSTGSVARSLGLLATLLSRWDEAARHFEAALAMNARMGARPWVARTRHDYARMLLDRSAAGDRERALELLRAAIATAEELGMVALRRRAKRLLDVGPPAASAPASETVSANSPERGVLRLEGEYWTVRYGEESCRLKDRKGLHHLARLLREPGREIHSLELVATEGEQPEPDGPDVYVDAAAASHVVGLGDAGAILDAEAKAAYRERLAELDDEIEQATACGDAERAERAAEEREFLLRELSAAVGLGGRDRRAGSAAERARVNVRRTIKSALERLREHCPALGEHLTRTVHTGTFCSYTPDPRAPITWDL